MGEDILGHLPPGRSYPGGRYNGTPAYTSRRDNLSATICLRLVGNKLSATRCVADIFAGGHTRHDATRFGDRLMHALLVVAAGTSATSQGNSVQTTLCHVQRFGQKLRNSKCVARTYANLHGRSNLITTSAQAFTFCSRLLYAFELESY